MSPTPAAFAYVVPNPWNVLSLLVLAAVKLPPGLRSSLTPGTLWGLAHAAAAAPVTLLGLHVCLLHSSRVMWARTVACG